MGFKKFTTFGSSSRSTITLRVNNTIFISKSMLLRLGLILDVRFAVVYLDDDGLYVGLKLSVEEPVEEGFRKLSIENSGVSLNIFAILRYFNIPKITSKKDLSAEIKDDMIIFSLKDLGV
jgi:hypothetical protein